MHYKETTELEIGKVYFNVTHWKTGEKDLVMEWTEDAPPPYTDNEVSIDIDKETAIELISVLRQTFEI